MKKMFSHTSYTIIEKFLFASIIAVSILFSSQRVWAQDVPEKVDVDIEANGDTFWYSQPWVWAVGVALFIIVIVAITRSGSNRHT